MTPLDKEAVLALLPQQRPMRFVSEIVELDEHHLRARYTWTEEDCAGHFPGRPVVPGTKIIEAAGQAGQAWALYLLSRSQPLDVIRQHLALFTGIEEGTFRRGLRPGQTMGTRAEFGGEGFLRRNKVVVEVTSWIEGGDLDGEEVFRGRLAGVMMLAADVEAACGDSR